MARWYWRGDSAGDGARSEENKEGKEERAEVEIELCEKGADREQLRVFFRVVVTINPISPVITSTNAG